MGFLDNLEKLMSDKNINRSDLARGIGVSTSTVNSWYNRSHENISLKTLKKLADYFGITLEELVYGQPIQKLTFDTNQYTEKEIEQINAYARFLRQNRESR